MAKKFYAVKVGTVPGIYKTWDECKTQVEGFPGAIYKGFATEQEALSFLNVSANNKALDADIPVAYVDGSFDVSSNTYSYGVVILYDRHETFMSGSDNNMEMASMRNVAGEILGSMAAMQFAIDNGIKEILIKHDYQGVASWCTGDWKCNKRCTMAYRDFYQRVSASVDVHFEKVEGHSGVFYNELADALARRELGLKVKASLEDYLDAAEEVQT